MLICGKIKMICNREMQVK